MPTLEALDALFKNGHYGELIQSAAVEGGASSLEPHKRVIVAHALVLTGALGEAASLLTARDGAIPQKLKARIEQVLGLCCQARGDVLEALQHFSSAMRLATESRDVERKAWTHLGLFRLQMHTEPAESISATLREVRRSVTAAGDPHVTAYLHVCVAVL